MLAPLGGWITMASLVWARWYVGKPFSSIGVMLITTQGYQMARNLQSKLQPSDKISIFDVNPESMKGLETEMKAVANGAKVELAASAFDASKDAVSFIFLYFKPICMMNSFCSIYDLSWGQSSRQRLAFL